jgi:hypothetical protein
MKNNINNLISEELQKAALLFNYDPKKTLSENIVEQTVGDKKFNFTSNTGSAQDAGIKYTPTSPADMLKNAQAAVAGTTPPAAGTTTAAGTTSAGTTPPAAGTTTAAGTTASGTTPPAAGTTPPAAGTTPPTSVLITKNDKSYDYKLENGKYYFKGKSGGKFATKYPNWVEAKAQKGIDSIKALFDKNPKGDTPVEPTTPQNATPPTDNAEKYKEFFAQKLKDAQNLPKTLPGVQGGETPKQQNDGITDSNTQVQGQIQSTISDDEEV